MAKLVQLAEGYDGLHVHHTKTNELMFRIQQCWLIPVARLSVVVHVVQQVELIQIILSMFYMDHIFLVHIVLDIFLDVFNTTDAIIM